MRSGTRVRSAADEDLPDLRRIAAEALDRERLDPAGVVDLLHHRPGVAAALRLVAVRDGAVAGFCYASTDGEVGHLDGLAVAARARRHGVATALVAEAGRRLGARGCRSLQTGGSTWHYAWPGIDLGYTAALVGAERAGFEQRSLAHNMDVDLSGWSPGRAAAALERAGPARRAVVRRARTADAPALHALVAEHFDAVWGYELDLALGRATPTAFVAEREGRVVGFAAHSVYRPDLFGPLGTDPAVRGTGAGQALLLACLDDLAAAGLAVAQISWIGPAGFYATTVDARIGRTFAVLARPLEPLEPVEPPEGTGA